MIWTKRFVITGQLTFCVRRRIRPWWRVQSRRSSPSCRRWAACSRASGRGGWCAGRECIGIPPPAGASSSVLPVQSTSSGSSARARETGNKSTWWLQNKDSKRMCVIISIRWMVEQLKKMEIYCEEGGTSRVVWLHASTNEEEKRLDLQMWTSHNASFIDTYSIRGDTLNITPCMKSLLFTVVIHWILLPQLRTE